MAAKNKSRVQRWMSRAFLTSFVTFITSGAAAADPLGFYLGAAVGQATIRVDHAALNEIGDSSVVSDAFGFSAHDTGWKITAGFRPVPFIGGEIEYVDFGNITLTRSSGSGFNFLTYRAESSAKAASAFGVLHAPVPLPLLDVYAKAGVARLQTMTSANGEFGCEFNCPLKGGSFYRAQVGARLAYGAGLQVNLWRVALRAEYERISAANGDPNLASVGAIWNF